MMMNAKIANILLFSTNLDIFSIGFPKHFHVATSTCHAIEAFTVGDVTKCNLFLSLYKQNMTSCHTVMDKNLSLLCCTF